MQSGATSGVQLEHSLMNQKVPGLIPHWGRTFIFRPANSEVNPVSKEMGTGDFFVGGSKDSKGQVVASLLHNSVPLKASKGTNILNAMGHCIFMTKVPLSIKLAYLKVSYFPFILFLSTPCVSVCFFLSWSPC